MVTTCSAIGCKERAKKGNKTTFHRFPSKPELREKWVKALKRANFEPTHNSRICEKHFKPECFVIFPNGRKTLKVNSVPDIFDFSEYISKTDSYKVTKPQTLEPSEKVVEKAVDSPAINCIQFVDVNSLPCDIPRGSNRTVIVIKSDNKSALENILPSLMKSSEFRVVSDSFSPKFENTCLQQLNNLLPSTDTQSSTSYPSITVQPPKIASIFSISKDANQSLNNLNNFTSPTTANTVFMKSLAFSTSSTTFSSSSVSQNSTYPTITKSVPSNTLSIHPIAQSSLNCSPMGPLSGQKLGNFIRKRYCGDFTTAHLTHKWGRKQFLSKVKELKKKYHNRLKTMITIRKQLNRRKAFLENLLIRIKEKQLTTDEDTIDLMDCFVEEESLESDEESDSTDSIAKTLTDMIDNKIIKITEDLNSHSGPQENECEAFALSVDSSLSTMPEENATHAKKRIKELIVAYKGKRLVEICKQGGYFAGLENIEIDN